MIVQIMGINYILSGITDQLLLSGTSQDIKEIKHYVIFNLI